MASIIRIKRSSTAGNPATLGAGELAYSASSGAGGNRLYVGMGSETAGNAANHLVIGGTYYTGLVDASVAGTLTTNASSIPVLSATGTIDQWYAGNLRLNGNTLSATNTNGGITLSPNGSGYVSITGTNALVIPVGTTAQRSPASNGAIRYNTDLSSYEGYSGAAWSSLGGVKSVDGLTYIKAEATPGSSDDTLYFYSNNVLQMSLNTDSLDIASTVTNVNINATTAASSTTTGALVVAGGAGIAGTLYVGGAINAQSAQFLSINNTPIGNVTPSTGKFTQLDTDNIRIDLNTISSTDTNGNITLAPNGTGKLVLNNPYINGTTDTLAEYIYDTVGGAITAGTGITITNSDPGNTSTVAIDSTVATLTGSQTLTNKTLTLPVIQGTGAVFNGSTSGTITVLATALAGTNTLTLPAATDTLVGKATTDTFTNKTFNTAATGNVFQINGTGITAVTGTGAVVLANTPTLITPVLGVATATSINKISFTTPATGATLTILDGKTLSVNNTLTFTGTDTSTVAFGSGGTVAYVANKLSVFASTTSAELAGVISDETGTGALVFANSPTLVTPTLGAALATSVTATSGNLTVAAASGNNSVNLVPTGTGTVDVNSKRITSVAEPTQAQDAATKAYVDAMSNGLDVKASVRLASAAPLTVTYSNGSSGVGATLTNAGTQAVLTLDGIPAVVADRVLIKDQSSAAQNGVYVVTSIGSASTNWVLTRAADFDNSPNTELSPGTFFFVEEGNTLDNNGYVISTNGAITIGTTAITFSQFSGAGQITAGDGLTKTGNTINAVGTNDRISISADAIDISANYVGQTSIVTLGTVTTATWNASIIGATYGGTGVNNGSNTITLGGNISTAGAFTTSGSFGVTLTATGTTSVTLPTSGTLATLAGSEALSNKTITASSFSGTTLAASGLVTFTNTTDAGPLGTAAVVLSGGLSVAKKIYVGTDVIGSGASTSNLDGFNIDGGTY